MLSLLNLPEQAKRLVTENLSADVEVINTVKTIENADPVAAKELVDELKKTHGQGKAREKANAAKEKVKPSKKPKTDKRGGSGAVATPKDRNQQEPGPVSGGSAEVGEEQGERGLIDAVLAALNGAYSDIFENGINPKEVLGAMNGANKEAVDTWLHSFYDAGVKAKDVGRAVIQGFRNGPFASEGGGAFALVAFLQGADSEAKYNLLNIFGSVKT
jgi:ParB family chromosome partitioning protein